MLRKRDTVGSMCLLPVVVVLYVTDCFKRICPIFITRLLISQPPPPNVTPVEVGTQCAYERWTKTVRKQNSYRCLVCLKRITQWNTWRRSRVRPCGWCSDWQQRAPCLPAVVPSHGAHNTLRLSLRPLSRNSPALCTIKCRSVVSSLTHIGQQIRAVRVSLSVKCACHHTDLHGGRHNCYSLPCLVKIGRTV
jgi:hypothetical protein